MSYLVKGTFNSWVLLVVVLMGYTFYTASMWSIYTAVVVYFPELGCLFTSLTMFFWGADKMAQWLKELAAFKKTEV